MRKLIIAVLALTGFSAACFALQTPAVKKTDPVKIHSPKKQTEVKASSKEVALNKVEIPAAAEKQKSAAHLKKHGTSHKHHKAKKKHN